MAASQCENWAAELHVHNMLTHNDLASNSRSQVSENRTSFPTRERFAVTEYRSDAVALEFDQERRAGDSQSNRRMRAIAASRREGLSNGIRFLRFKRARRVDVLG